MRIGKAIATVTVLSAAIATFGLATSQPTTYGKLGVTRNGGLYVGDCYTANVGLELWGTPGFYTDEC